MIVKIDICKKIRYNFAMQENLSKVNNLKNLEGDFYEKTSKEIFITNTRQHHYDFHNSTR